jgi:hypothetical protein
MRKLNFLVLFFLATYSGYAQLVINEYMPYPSSTGVVDPNELDSNKDGALGGTSDEYIELVNSGASALDITGWKISDGSVRHIFPSTVVPAGGAVIVFGGGTGLSIADFGNSIVQTATEGTSLGLLNSGDTFNILDGSDAIQLTETYAPASPGIAFSRNLDITGGFSTHPANASLLANGGDFAFASPGTKIDGTFFIVPTSSTVQFSSTTESVDESGGTVSLVVSIVGASATNTTEVEVALTKGTATDIDSYITQTVTFAAGSSADQVVTITITDDSIVEGDEDLVFALQNPSGGDTAILGTNTSFTLTIIDNDFTPTDMVVNEFMPWPAGATSADTQFDSNGDGVYSSSSDEYIEYVNTGAVSLDISGWKINNGIDRHIFPSGTVVPAGGVILVFGGGTPNTTPDYFGNAIVQTASESTNLGLLNSGDTSTLKDATDETRISFTYGAATRAVAFTRNPDVTGTSFEQHPINALLQNEDGTDANASPGTKIDGAILSSATLEAFGVKMYPNPASDGLVYIKLKTAGDKNIELYDINGRSVLQVQLKSDVLDVSSVKSGFYLLKISTGDYSATSKLIIK